MDGLYIFRKLHKILPQKFTRCAETAMEDTERTERERAVGCHPSFLVSTVIFQSGLHCAAAQTGRPPVTR